MRTVLATLLAATTIVLIFSVVPACARRAARTAQLPWWRLASPEPSGSPTAPQKPEGLLPPVAELDALCAPAFKGVRQGAQVISAGADYAAAETTTGREESIEVEETSLNLRAYRPGEYTYALFAQEIGDGVMGGGQDDDIPLQSLLDTEACTYGGGQDDDIPLLFFVGLADYTAGAWRWFGPYTEGGPTLKVYSGELKNRFKSPSDHYYVVILAASPGRGASALPAGGCVAELPFDPGARAAAQEGEAPGGVRINWLVTDVEAGHQTIPAAVTGLEAAVGGSSVTLTWDGNPDPEVTHHEVWRLEPGVGEWTHLDDVGMPQLTYEDLTAAADTTYIYGVCAVNGAGTGGRGQVSCGPPMILGVTPTAGNLGDTVTFAMTLLGSGPFAIEWDFGSAATPNTSTEAKPVVTLNDVGDHFAWVMADNALGHDSIDFVLTVEGPPGEWHIQVVDGVPGKVRGDASLAVINGNPAISYASGVLMDAFDLKYVRATSPEGSAWGTPVTIDSLYNLAGGGLVVVNGNPAVSYWDYDSHHLRYARALDENGDSWGTPVTVDSSGDAGYDNSLAVVNGYPAISYHYVPGDCLNYVRATDANGDAWGAPITVDSTSGTGYSNRLVFVNFAPAIAYCNDNLNELRFVLATDFNGTAWRAPVTVDSAGADSIYQDISMIRVGPYPAISYPGDPDSDLKFVRAVSFDGSTWGAPVIVDSADNVGDWSSLAMVNGRPAISYLSSSGDLSYVRAGDPWGDSWGTPETIDSPGLSGVSSLLEVNGCPAIAYDDTGTGELKFAIYY